MILTAHAAERAIERYGVTLTEHLAAKFVSQIEAGNCIRLPCPRKHWVRKYLVAADGITLPVAFDRKNKIIITVLPMASVPKKHRLPVPASDDGGER